VTASYGADRGTVAGILTGAAFPAANPAPAAKANNSAVAGVVAAVAAGSTNYTGKGFDPCTAPSGAAMSAWKSSSPYGAIGVYIGGSDRACSQPNLTASWVSAEASAGWRFLPLYVGPQAAFGELTSPASQAVSAANDAVTQAASLGFGAGTVVYYDMEGYGSGYRSAALTFMSNWTSQLHAKGYRSGIYSSSSSGITDLANNISSYTMPDVIDDALWNGVANTADPNIPATVWVNHQRVHQYSGGHDETYGGYTINIDQDYFDVQQGTSGGYRADIAWLENGTVFTFSGSGLSTVGSVSGIYTAAWAGVGDYHHDGKDDLYWYQSTNVYVLESNGTAFHSIGSVRGPGVGAPTWAATGSFS
jgi:hypothetical protein